MRLKHNLPRDIALCAQEDCVLKTDCLRSLALQDGREERVVMTEFPPVKTIDQGCQYQIPMPSISEIKRK